MVVKNPHYHAPLSTRKKQDYFELIWVEKIREGDEKTFEVMFLTYYAPCVNLVNQIMGSVDLSECLVQDVFARIWEIRENWSPLCSVNAYLFKASKNKAYDYLKHEKIKQRYIDEKSLEQIEYSRSPNELLEETNLIAAVQTAIEKLPARGKLVYELHRQNGLTYKEIAKTLDISPKTVESQMSRVLNKLRQQLTHYLP
ncbi:MAG: RNA polymerase sigma-70 factor [Balneolales bacterium]